MIDENRKQELTAMSQADLVAHALDLESFIHQQTRILTAYGNSNRMLLQAGTWLDQFDWKAIKEPYALMQVLHLVAFAFKRLEGVLPEPED